MAWTPTRIKGYYDLVSAANKSRFVVVPDSKKYCKPLKAVDILNHVPEDEVIDLINAGMYLHQMKPREKAQAAWEVSEAK